MKETSKDFIFFSTVGLFFCLFLYTVVALGLTWDNNETKILPDIQGLVPNEISLTRRMSFFPIRFIKYHWNSSDRQEEVKKTDFDIRKVLFEAKYDPEIGRIVEIESKNQLFYYSSETKAWTVKTKESGYERVIPSDNQSLKDEMTEAEKLLTYARKRFRKIIERTREKAEK